MTIKDLREASATIKDAWFEFFVAEVTDQEGEDYMLTLQATGVDVTKVMDTIETQGYWSGVRRNYYWVPELLSFITEGRWN